MSSAANSASCLLAGLLALAVPVVAGAQSPQSSAAPALTFAGAGGGVTSVSPRSRAGTRTDSTPASLRLEAGIALGRRAGVGAAFMPFAELVGDRNVGRVALTDRQREQAWLGEVRVRTLTSGHGAVDITAGAGVLRQQREGAYTLCNFTTCTTVVADEPRRSSPVVTAGVDVPWRMTPHLTLAAVTRVLWLRRGVRDVTTWPRRNSTEISAIVSLRVTP